jgi:hypothetical protein
MNQLYTSAIRKSSELRLKLGYNLYEPINIYEICSQLGIDVQFVDINMEGLYVKNNNLPKIIISCLRPFPRRVFTCGHEIGHHVFGHGLRVDILSDDSESSKLKNDDEILVDAFSAHLLMPVLAIQSEFKKRKLDFHTAQPIDYYSVSSVLGVGYSTLVVHCSANRLIRADKAIELSKFTPARLFKTHIGTVQDRSYFKIIDIKNDNKPIDLEVGNYIVLPPNFDADKNFLEKMHLTEKGNLFCALKSGITSIYSNTSDINCKIRIQPQNYVGFADYRHFEN